MPLVTPLSPDHDPETRELAEFFNETLGFCPNSVLTMQRRPAISKAFINLNKAVMANEGRVTSALKRIMSAGDFFGYVKHIHPKLHTTPSKDSQQRKDDFSLNKLWQ